MDRIIDAAHYLFNEYKEISGGDALDEMRSHILLYLAQRESLAMTGRPLFREHFEGWKLGPVSPDVREVYSDGGIQAKVEDVSPETAMILNTILDRYGAVGSWSLSQLSREEISWRNARAASDESGDNELRLEDIMEDAKKVRQFDYLWGMYYDEFEDIPAEEVPYLVEL